MKNDARKLSTEEQHLIRKLAVQRVHAGESAADVIRSFGLGARAIFTWLRIVREKGYAADLNPDGLVWNQMRNIGTSKKTLKK